MLSDDDKRQIDEQIATRLDAESIVAIFRDSMDERAKEELADAISRFMYDRQKKLPRPQNTYTPRYLLAGQDINNRTYGATDAQDQVGYAGPTLPRIVNLDSGFQARLSASDPQQIDISASGGAACVFDYLVSSCFTSLPGFTEGKSFTSLSGCTFKGYSKLFGPSGAFLAAWNQAVADGLTRGAAVIAVCAPQDETVTTTTTLPTGGPNIWVQGLSSIIGNNADGSGNYLWPRFNGPNGAGFLTPASGGTYSGSHISFTGIGFGAASGQVTAIWNNNVSGVNNSANFHFRDVTFGSDGNSSAEILYILRETGLSQGELTLDHCRGTVQALRQNSTTATNTFVDTYQNNVMVMTHIIEAVSSTCAVPPLKMRHNSFTVNGYGLAMAVQAQNMMVQNNELIHTTATKFFEWDTGGVSGLGNSLIEDNLYIGSTAGCQFIKARSTFVGSGFRWTGNMIIGPGSGTAIDVDAAKFTNLTLDNTYVGWATPTTGATDRSNASFITINAEPGLGAERAAFPGNNQYITDGGANDVVTFDTWLKGSDVASATALTLPVGADYFHVTGTSTSTTIQSNDAGASGYRLLLTFDAAATLVNSGSLILSGGANLTTTSGQTLEFILESAWDAVPQTWRQISSGVSARFKQEYISFGSNILGYSV